MHINGQPFSNKLKVFASNTNASNQFNCRDFDGKKNKRSERKQMKRNNEIDLFFFLCSFFDNNKNCFQSMQCSVIIENNQLLNIHLMVSSPSFGPSEHTFFVAIHFDCIFSENY